MRLPSPLLRASRTAAPSMMLAEPSALLAEASAAVGGLTTTGWDGPGLIESGGKGLSYWDLHGFLLLPTLWLLTAGSPALLDENSDPLKRRASFAFVAFILSIAVGQAFVWDSVGAQIGIWEFNPEKCTGLGESTLLPLEEILWLFHHVIKAALWQLKIAEVNVVRGPPGTMPAPMAPQVRVAGNTLLAAATVGGVMALLGDVDEAKCVGLVATFFAPVLAIVYNLGSRYFLSHWRLFVAGWVVPGWWTVFIDCIGQQQGVWSFPSTYLSGVSTLDGWLKLDIAMVYLVSTFAVTATGAIIIAAAEEFQALRQPQLAEGTAEYAADGQPPTLGNPALVSEGALNAATRAGNEPALWSLGLFIFDNAFEGAAGVLQRRLLQLGGDTSPRPLPPSEEQRGSIAPTGGGDTASFSASSRQGDRSSSE